MQPQHPPGRIPTNDENKDVRKSVPTVEIEAKSPDFSVEKKRSEILSNDDEGSDKKEAPEVTDQQQAP